MIVSPSQAARRLLELLLSREGCSVTTTADADEALDHLSTTKAAAELVLVDARAEQEEMKILLGLLKRRHPALPRMTLFTRQIELLAGESRHTLAFAAEQAFPSQADLQRLLSLVRANRMLEVFSPPPGKA